jgi:hypothetical protein
MEREKRYLEDVINGMEKYGRDLNDYMSTYIQAMADWIDNNMGSSFMLNLNSEDSLDADTKRSARN